MEGVPGWLWVVEVVSFGMLTVVELLDICVVRSLQNTCEEAVEGPIMLDMNFLLVDTQSYILLTRPTFSIASNSVVLHTQSATTSPSHHPHRVHNTFLLSQPKPLNRLRIPLQQMQPPRPHSAFHSVQLTVHLRHGLWPSTHTERQ